jgi:hypothetical protein
MRMAGSAMMDGRVDVADGSLGRIVRQRVPDAIRLLDGSSIRSRQASNDDHNPNVARAGNAPHDES